MLGSRIHPSAARNGTKRIKSAHRAAVDMPVGLIDVNFISQAKSIPEIQDAIVRYPEVLRLTGVRGHKVSTIPVMNVYVIPYTDAS